MIDARFNVNNIKFFVSKYVDTTKQNLPLWFSYKNKLYPVNEFLYECGVIIFTTNKKQADDAVVRSNCLLNLISEVEGSILSVVRIHDKYKCIGGVSLDDKCDKIILNLMKK